MTDDAHSRSVAAGTRYSFEFFPPRTPEAEERSQRTLVDLEPLQPSYVSVTYGAGGSTRERTHDLVVDINERHVDDRDGAPHVRRPHPRRARRDRHPLPATPGSRTSSPSAATRRPTSTCRPASSHHAIELVRLVREVGDFAVGVAAHPEPHPRSPTVESDRRHTAEKLAEADFAITQFFFEPHHYFDLVESLRALGVDKPVIPGIMPVTSISAIARMAKMQGSEFPEWLAAQAPRGGGRSRRRCGASASRRPPTLCRALARRRRAGAALLHAQPVDRDPRDLREPRARRLTRRPGSGRDPRRRPCRRPITASTSSPCSGSGSVGFMKVKFAQRPPDARDEHVVDDHDQSAQAAARGHRRRGDLDLEADGVVGAARRVVDRRDVDRARPGCRVGERVLHHRSRHVAASGSRYGASQPLASFVLASTTTDVVGPGQVGLPEVGRVGGDRVERRRSPSWSPAHAGSAGSGVDSVGRRLPPRGQVAPAEDGLLLDRDVGLARLGRARRRRARATTVIDDGRERRGPSPTRGGGDADARALPDVTCGPLDSSCVAEGVGFEPTVPIAGHNGFRDRPVRPLRHPSVGDLTGCGRCLPRFPRLDRGAAAKNSRSSAALSSARTPCTTATLVVESRIRAEVVQRAERPGLRVGRAEHHESGRARRAPRPRTSGTARACTRARSRRAATIPTAAAASRSASTSACAVGSPELLALVVPAGEHLAVGDARDDRADRHVAVRDARRALRRARPP